MAKHRIVITGGGGSGKSSLIEYFIENGYCAIREAAREQIRLSLEQNSRALPWDDILEFSYRVQAQMLLDYNLFPDAHFCFYDRCLLDVLSYLHLDGKEGYPTLEDDIENHPYFEKVFVLPPWRDIFTQDDERTESFEDTVRAYDTIKLTYQSKDYEVVEIPQGTIEERATFILEELRKMGIHE